MSETRPPCTAPQRPNLSPGGAKVTHAGLVRLVADYLAANGAWVYKVLGGLGSRPGCPDVLACRRGLMVAVEVKTGQGRLSPQQKRERDALLAAGAVYCECRRIEDLERTLIEAGLIPRARVI